MQRTFHALAALALAGCTGAGLLGAPCDSSRECSEEGLVCDTAAHECVECVGDVDCLEAGEICLGRSCRAVTSCTSSRQCPGQVCDAARGYCVDCVADVDCAGELVCGDGVCVEPPPSCESDRQCSELGLVCDTGSGVCVECVRAEDCGADEICSSERRCVDAPATGCEAGTRECVGDDAFRRCMSDGTWSEAESCLEGQSCAGGACSDPSCDPPCGADEMCLGGTCQVLRCSPDCTGDEVCASGVCRCGDGARCEGGTVCSGGECVATSCDPACAVGEGCLDGACRCGAGPACEEGRVCEGGACVTPACAPACDTGEVCVEGSCRCGSGPSCADGERCDAGTCRPIACTPACDAGETCVSGACRCGAGPACSTGQECVSGACVSTTCSPACAAGETCDAGACRCGAGPACTGGRSCVSGTCTSTCSESPCRLVSPQCGCSAGQACDLSGGTRGCFAAGTRTEAQACDSTNRCAAGLTCSGPSSAPFCARYCATDADCPAGGGSICLMEINDSSGAVLANLCGIDCDPRTNTGCRSSTACSIRGVRSGTNEAVTWCRAVDPPFPFPICTDTTCPAGQVCTGSGACAAYCRVGVASDCPAPQICTQFTDRPRVGGVEYGYCQ